MPQVHPHYTSFSPPKVLIDDKFCSNSCTIFTVWKKSLVFNTKGFTVFDSCGNLVFRVDNYASNADREIVLMDHAGNVVMTLRRKRLSVQNRWEAFRGEAHKSEMKPIFTLTKSSLLSNKTTADVFVNGSRQTRNYDYQMEGSLCKPSCAICSASGDIVAQVKEKEAKADVMMGKDVFSLVIQPGMDQAFIMGLLIIFNQIS